MITAKNIKKKYNNQEVLRGIDLKIDENEFVVILGASGSGKSTLLNILSGLEKSDSGEVVYDNESISDYSEKQLTKFRKEKIGFVFQQYYLLNNLTIEQNVKVGANLADNKEYVDIIKDLGLEDKLSKYPNELSGGEQQRVSIARALAKKPTVLFLDEPTGALDEETGRKILEYLLKLKDKSHFTMIMVTHNENIAELANKIIHVGSGRITSIVENHKPKSVEEIGGNYMIVQLKDLRKAIAVVIVSFCAVFITTLFSNLYLDLKVLDTTGFNIMQKKFYDAQLIVSKFVIIITGTVLSISAAVMLIFYIKQFIDDSKHKIGILKAQGYSNSFIASRFSIFGFLVFLGSLLGYGSSHLFMPKFYESRNTDNILSELTMNFHPQLLLIMVILPSLLFLVISIVYVMFNLNVPTINLLKQINSTNKIIRKRKFRKYKNFFKELRATVLFSNKTLLFFVIFAALSFSSMIQMAFGMRDFVDGTIRIMMMIIGVILSLSILLISLEVIASSNIKNISILNIMGFSKSECSKIVLSGYRVVAYIGFAVGTVYQYFLIRALLKVLSKKLDSETTYNFDLISVIGSFIAFVLIYEIFILYYSNKIKDLNVKKIMME